MRFIGCLVFAASLAACASAKKGEEPAPQPVREIVSGGARIRGGGFRMDVQVGRTFVQTPVQNATVTAKPAAVVTP